MIIKSGDYVIVPVGEKLKKYLVCVKEKSNNFYSGYISPEGDQEPYPVEFESRDVIANLGNDPKIGTAYGVRVEPWFDPILLKGWGEVKVFRHLEKEEKSKFKKIMREVFSVLDERGLTNQVLTKLVVHIRPERGVYAGSYKYIKKEDQKDILTLHPVSLTEESLIYYIIFHEFAHHVWYRIMDLKFRAKWIEYYHKCVETLEVGNNRLNSLRESYIEAGSTSLLRKNLKEQDPDLLELLKETMKWIKRNHKLTSTHLDTIITSDSKDFIYSVWPEKSISINTVHPLVSDYGAKSPEEFWAEAMSFYLAGFDMDSKISKKVKKTLEILSNMG